MARLLCVGDVNADVTIATETPIAPGSDTAGRVRLAAGGSAANVAAVAAASGTSTRFVGVLGDDLLGRFLVDELEQHGVEVRPIVRPGRTSRAIAAVIDPGGDRSMVSDLDHSNVLRVDDVEPSWFDDIDWLHLTAYSWFPPGGDEVVARLLKSATDRGISWSIDPSSAQMLASERSIDDALRAFAGSTVIVPNHDEASMLTGIDDPTDAAMQLLDISSTVVVTCGADGVVVASRGRPPFHVAAQRVDVVNTLGAGDAFAAGFITARLAGHDDRAAAHAGLTAAAHAVTRPTAR